jgi:ligand-binding sensor domain-containing protein
MYLMAVLLHWNLSMGQGIPPIGQWREHLPWNNALQVAASGNTIIAATPYAVFTYDISEASFVRKSKVNGLNEIGVGAMGYDKATGKTIIAYKNSNIDVLLDDRTTNIPDIRISSVQGDKTVNRILADNNKAWLSTGLGVIVLDLVKNEVRATWKPSSIGNAVAVYGTCFYKDTVYVATAEGVRRSAVKDDPSDYRNWTAADPALTSKADHVLSDNTNLYTLAGNRLLKWSANRFILVYSSPGKIISADLSGPFVLISEQVGNRGRVVQLDAVGNIVRLYQPSEVSKPMQALLLNGECWIADQDNGLLRTNGSTAERIYPNSPINIASGEMKYFNSTLWAAAGTVNEAWNYSFNPNGVFRFGGERWDGYNLYVYPKIDSLLDYVTVTGQPSTGSVFAGSYGGGLLEITADGKLNIFKQNSPLQPAIGDPGSYRVSGLATDAFSNIWIANYGSPRNLHVKKADGQWRSFSIPFFHLENAVSQITVDEYDQKWIVSPKGNGLFLYNSGTGIDNLGDDRWKYYRQGKGNGNLPSSTVYCTAVDRNGFVWVGTAKGIGIITCGPEAANSNCEAILPVVQQDNFAGFLFQDEEVLCIAVDGANRKWVGTRNGLWLISEEGDKVIYRFTKENSALLANEISALAIDPVSGELFIGTSSGICSFRGTATEGGEKHTNVLVYPNPVPSDYSGTIGIRGLAYNSMVKITEPDGKLVYQVRAQGGQATWNGKDYKGNRVSSGVYLVFAADEQNIDRLVTKIFFVK